MKQEAPRSFFGENDVTPYFEGSFKKHKGISVKAPKNTASNVPLKGKAVNTPNYETFTFSNKEMGEVLESAHQVRKSMHREGKKLYQEAKRKAGGKMETAVTKIIDDLLVRKSMSYAEAMNEFSEKEYEGLLRTFKLITIVTVIALLLILAHPSIMEAINNIK